MTTFGLAFTSALVDFMWQGTLVALALLAALHTVGRRSARVRYGLSTVALVVLMVLPVITTVWGLRVTSASSAPAMAVPFTIFAGREHQLSAQVLSTPAVAQPLLIRLQPWVLPVWSLGVLLLSLRLVAGGLEVRALRRNSSAADESLRERVATL